MNNFYKYLEEDKQASQEFGGLGDGLPDRGSITIPKPLAQIGDEVVVDNYRKRYDSLDRGKVTGLECLFDEDLTPSWRYDVRLKDQKYTIRVRDLGIHENLTLTKR